MGAAFQGISTDFKGRIKYYKHDWVSAFSSGARILAPTFYIFFASALPVIAFGEQLSRDTGGRLSAVEALTSTALCGIIHSIFGGQPLLILGVAEPTHKPSCNWQRALFALGWMGLCMEFTRVAGELFGMLITVLFFQEAVKGVVEEFREPKSEHGEKAEFYWQYINGLFAVIFAFGVLLTSMQTRKARSWLYGTGWMRSLLADYGIPLMVVLWTAVSYAKPRGVPKDVPRRLDSPLPWEPQSLYHWTIVKDMGKVPIPYIFAGIIPAVMIAGLYFFDHNVASQMAQQHEYNLQKPSSYHCDMLLLGIMTLICGLLGVPPSNGVLPQSPMHTKSLAVLKRQMLRKKMVKSARECIRMNKTNSEIYGEMHDVLRRMDAEPTARELQNLREAVMNPDNKDGTSKGFDPEKHIDEHLPVRVKEQRVSNLLQSVLIGLSVLAISVIKRIPTSVLWGYFAYMAIDSLPGNQFWERILLLFVTKSRRSHASYVETVPYKTIVTFTALQILYFGICFGLTWVPVGGILFPLPFFLLIVIRERLLPKMFNPDHLKELDSSEYEEVEGAPQLEPDTEDSGEEDEFCDAELLDEMTTHRGELKHRNVSFDRGQRTSVDHHYSSEMGKLGTPFKGIIQDVKGRAECYKQDWVLSFCSGLRLLAPTFYIFFASALPVIAFGEQLSRDTDGSLSTVEALASTAICGIIHSIIGGQPLLIVGVAEPTVIMYSYLYNFSKKTPELGAKLFLPWAGWVNVWSALFLIVLGIFNACTVITRFTRVAGELFGMLITVLFFQQAIKGLVEEFGTPKNENQLAEEFQFQWRYINGLLGIIFSFGVLVTSLKTRKARTWLYGTGWLRSFIADYGVPLMVVLWTALSYVVPGKVPEGVPRRLVSPLPWESASLYHWTVVKDMGQVPFLYIVAAIIPAFMIAGLYFFDHSVSSQMAQQEEFNLQKPSAYHYDMFLLGIMTLICGLLGLPPSNGVIPQSPMHTKSLAVLRKQLIRKEVVKSAKECIKLKKTKSEIYGKMQAVFEEMDTDPTAKELENLKEAVMNPDAKDGTKKNFDLEEHIDDYLPVRVNEQRMTNLMQSLLIGLSVLAISIIKRIPTSVLWGYFAYMAIDSLPGNQFWERILLLFIAPRRRSRILEGSHASFVETVPFKTIAAFTGFQLAYFAVCYGMTWIPIGGILFPLPFFLLILVREHLLPRLFKPRDLQELDASEYEEILGAPRGSLSMSLQDKEPGDSDESVEDYCDAEILDEMTTSRGELKLRAVSFNDGNSNNDGNRSFNVRNRSFNVRNRRSFNARYRHSFNDRYLHSFNGNASQN
ncbi:hypothetical protein Ahy_A08g040848 isoform B [Arachis hypogaea]|uniref:Bicarbonate transporter-like transmembrane domain-containing protein n=1 Tax=Arachis hypogaea TaxID=3818 RepID=A0A445C0S7_ARAHY|nr:hypothetical protein Ahy_A08g040848 isoform B [Arachis hypogaea]